MENRHGCLRCLCCACCLPVWATAIVWFILISIIIVVIVIGAVAGTFVLPTVGMNGVVPTNGSQFSFSGYEFKINFGLLVSVNNPNLLSIGLSDVTATVSTIENCCVTMIFKHSFIRRIIHVLEVVAPKSVEVIWLIKRFQSIVISILRFRLQSSMIRIRIMIRLY